MKIRLYMDEDSMDHDVVAALRLRGVDVTTALEQGMIDRDDADHLSYATAQGRVLCSFNVRDFSRLHVVALVLAKGATAFGMMESAWGQFLVSSRFMRAFYGAAKTVAFVYLALLAAADVAWRDTAAEAGTGALGAGTGALPLLHTIGLWLTVLVVGLTVLRGIPVFIEARRFFASPRSTP